MSSVTMQTQTFGGLTQQCISGVVSLFRFIAPPSPGSIIGNLQLQSGAVIPLIQSGPTAIGGPTLSSVDGQSATLCGSFVRSGNQTVFDVRVVIPGALPLPAVDSQLLLLLLLLLLLSGRSGGGGLGVATITNILGQLSAGGLQAATLTSLLSQMGLSAASI